MKLENIKNAFVAMSNECNNFKELLEKEFSQHLSRVIKKAEEQNGNIIKSFLLENGYCTEDELELYDFSQVNWHIGNDAEVNDECLNVKITVGNLKLKGDC